MRDVLTLAQAAIVVGIIIVGVTVAAPFVLAGCLYCMFQEAI